MTPSRCLFTVLCGTLALALTLTLGGCRVPAPTPLPTPDYTAQETQVAVKLAATLTAKAPPTLTPTPTLPRPTNTPSPTPTATPTPAPTQPIVGTELAYVRVLPDDSTNIVRSDETQQNEQLLTHFVETENMCDVAWAPGGGSLVFVSAHDFVHSRNNERNVFTMRADGTGLRMVTGDHVDPQSAAGPYVVLSGVVSGCDGPALISAQGVPAPVTTDAAGAFELVGVPVTARWARAICPGGAYVLQGDTDLALLEGENDPIAITVEAQGQGWTQAALAPDGHTIAGLTYRWVLDAEGNQEHSSIAVLQDLETGERRELALPEGMGVTGMAWSIAGDVLMGALAGENGAALWRWDAAGNDLGEFLSVANPDDTMYSLHDLAWSPDGRQLALSRKAWGWWGDEQYRADLMVLAVDSEEPELRMLVESEWGSGAAHPTWTEDGGAIYYQVAPADAGNGCAAARGDIWRLRLAAEGEEQPAPEPWRSDQRSSLPVVRPLPTPTVAPTPTAEAPVPEDPEAGESAADEPEAEQPAAENS